MLTNGVASFLHLCYVFLRPLGDRIINLDLDYAPHVEARFSDCTDWKFSGGPLYLELEPVSQIQQASADQCLMNVRIRNREKHVDILRRPSPVSESQLEGQSPLERPSSA